MSLLEGLMTGALVISLLTNLLLGYIVREISQHAAYERTTHSSQMLMAAQAAGRAKIHDSRRPGTPRGEPPKADREEVEEAVSDADKPHPRDPDHPDRPFFG